MAERQPISFNEVQERQAAHTSGLSISHTSSAYDPFETVRRLKEEVDELEEAIRSGDQLKIESEIGDILGLTTQTAENHGIDSGKAALEKIAHNEQRYPRLKINALLNSGMEPREIFPHLRELRKQERYHISHNDELS